MDGYNGAINVLKPSGLTSSDVVVRLKRILGQKKVGHTGTLDPGAAGVLPIVVGRATKISDYLMGGEKVYLAEITFGAATDTLDSYGKVLRISEKRPQVRSEALLEAAAAFVGKQWQQPPMYSAIKQNGQKMYELARKGQQIDIPKREVEIYDIELVNRTGAYSYLLKIRCSKGTYVRTLISEIGQHLGELSYTSFLMRAQTGNFYVQDSWTLEEIEECVKMKNRGFLTSVEKALEAVEELVLPDDQFKKILNGCRISLSQVQKKVQPEKMYRIYCRGELIGLGGMVAGAIKLNTMLLDRENGEWKSSM